jgi:hypothetical protein
MAACDRDKPVLNGRFLHRTGLLADRLARFIDSGRPLL